MVCFKFLAQSLSTHADWLTSWFQAQGSHIQFATPHIKAGKDFRGHSLYRWEHRDFREIHWKGRLLGLLVPASLDGRECGAGKTVEAWGVEGWGEVLTPVLTCCGTWWDGCLEALNFFICKMGIITPRRHLWL